MKFLSMLWSVSAALKALLISYSSQIYTLKGCLSIQLARYCLVELQLQKV